MGGPGALKKWVTKGLANKDYIHLKPTGYRKLADAFVHDVMAQMQYARAKQEQTALTLAAAKKASASNQAATDESAPKGGDEDKAPLAPPAKNQPGSAATKGAAQ